MSETNYRILTGRDLPDLMDLESEVTLPSWPEFMLHDPVADKHWGDLHRLFPAFQYALVDTSSDNLLAIGNSVPLEWNQPPEQLPDEGWDWMIVKAIEDNGAGRSVKTQGAVQIVVALEHRGRGLAELMINAMMSIGRAHGLTQLIAPVRPTLKARYPLISMEKYIRWRGTGNQAFDPWIRLHARMGAGVVRVCPQSMRIAAPVKQWENWTDLRLPESGDYVIPGALRPVEVNVEKDEAVYVEPNVWMEHRLDASHRPVN
jgi:GNAT superfamily N-acetyltransferase